MESNVADASLVQKYNLPVPRYTSYPTVPYWTEKIDKNAWVRHFQEHFEEENYINGISLYLHLPFCESLCTYCGCNKKITTNHQVEEPYITALEREWNLYRKFMKQTPVIRELHLGGGTPTFFSPKNLKQLLVKLLGRGIIHPKHEFNVEGHPNNTTESHLDMLYGSGFRRISFGVQDTDPQVQRAINRIQPLERLQWATEQARSKGFSSINFDLIYGLPFQTLKSIENSTQEVLKLKPDRIAFYSYAHVPWTSKAQRLFSEKNLPSAELKIQLYLRGKELIQKAGYIDIGMDHFALSTDSLYKASISGMLHRNFMGYTTQHTNLLIGLGVSSISDIGIAYAQNAKSIHNYYGKINQGHLAIEKGFFLNKEDQSFQRYIQEIACQGSTTFREEDLPVLEEYSFPVIEQLRADGLVERTEDGISLTSEGHHFIRIVCSAFDLYLQRENSANKLPVFSKAI
jgi:oxygen-independent coproporphyrinogen III oxidase